MHKPLPAHRYRARTLQSTCSGTAKRTMAIHARPKKQPSWKTRKTYSADVVLAQTSVIRNWHFKLVSSATSRYWFVLYGTVNNSFIKSSLVTDVVEDVARTENSFYRLCGDMSAKCDPHRHFNKELLKKFQHGFPPNWRSLLESEIRRIVELETSLSAKEEASKAAGETRESKKGCMEGKVEDSTYSAETKYTVKSGAGNRNVSEEGFCRSADAGLLGAPSNVARARLSLEKKLIAQKTAEILCSDDENTLFFQESSEKDTAANGEAQKSRKATKASAHKRKKAPEAPEKMRAAARAGDGGGSPAGVGPSRDAGDGGGVQQVAVARKRVSFNTNDIQEIILSGAGGAASAEEDVPAVQMDQATDTGPGESKEETSGGTGGALQAQAMAQPRRRGRKKKSPAAATEQKTAKDCAGTKSGDEKKSGVRKRRRRLTMPADFKA
ncbi:UNVERIFIED_CONTAM: hypothetical protein PYX00_011787 [Menopon gallinae]|uniref:SANTA domain-containing protein n=1 Tax=Menopon gallinae TaxID=328185 RepID=A0AAW2H8N6_9NEOP